ncbi:DMT family transporter [Humidisolicoccus flavus]|uniref:DMT family transporter n=1 Tax=Humidisolicoccus flavus TaxID=3111414 RepID=UPI003247EC15
MLLAGFPDISEISLTPLQALGIPIALVGAVFLSLGAQFQHRGVDGVQGSAVKTGASLGLKNLLQLLRRPSWVIGTIMLGLAVVFQLTSLSFAPLIVVQPLGAVALVITAVVNSRVAKIKLDSASVKSIAYCLFGIGVFVTVAAMYAVERPIRDNQLGTVLALLVVAGVGLAVAWFFFRTRANAVFYVAAAGGLYGFVVTLAKVVLNRITSGNFEWLTVLCIVALIATALLGGYFVQLAYASGPPDLVIAGLTVIDPLVAVLIGVTVLGEAAQTPPWALIVFAGAGALAIFGVFQIAKHHPQLKA